MGAAVKPIPRPANHKAAPALPPNLELNDFLENNGISSLREFFLQKGITLDDVLEMDKNEVEELGIPLYRDRKLLLRAIQNHKEENDQSRTSDNPAVSPPPLQDNQHHSSSNIVSASQATPPLLFQQDHLRSSSNIVSASRATTPQCLQQHLLRSSSNTTSTTPATVSPHSNQGVGAEVLPELTPEDRRVARMINNNSDIVCPSVSYLTQLCVLARHNMIGEYQLLSLDKEYSGVRWLGELVSKARMLIMRSGTVLSRTPWEELGRVASSNWRVSDLVIDCNIPDYVLGILTTNTETVWICYYAPHLVDTIAQGINTGHIVRCRVIVLWSSMENQESVGRELQTRLGWRLRRDSNGYIILER